MANPDSRIIRVFLSSTFRDFMEERDLLVKQVFPELRRKARERGVEVVDVDLRWGITEEESRQGKVIPICLGEIDRCRPYFVGMLGERYGWIPPADQYSPEVIERQPWLKDHLGGVSVTELEILHGVLNDPAMAGRAFFYFRDPRWSRYPDAPGYVCETAEEEAKLRDLKERIRSSGFPVAENLPDPKALADQIGRDLWKLIEEQYPDLDEADALEREERQHASYRRSRLGIYLGGKRSINQLERWIDAGQQKILITGESGAGKSALIANWIEVHRQTHPEDVVFAHHLGCSNDASAIRPLLARLIDTAKQKLPEVYGYSLSVPQDWWELVAKTVEALQSLGRWAQQSNHRWIWVLDGLDRLDPDDQKALPWLPLTIPEGVVIVASALECPAREILLERKCKTRTIAPLTVKEQDALIKQYLGRYTKQLIAELRQRILSHPLAGSPLFLRVLLEEMRQCGRYETLADQLAGYLSAETIDDLYERVLERLEADGNAKNVRKVMTALWASRAGLSEEELLSITGLKPLQWAPIDLALEEALGRNGNRLVFDHQYLQIAVRNRYACEKDDVIYAHSTLADYFRGKEWSERKGAEYFWQLYKADRLEEIRSCILSVAELCNACGYMDDAEIIDYWHRARHSSDGELDSMIYEKAMHEVQEKTSSPKDVILFVDRLSSLLDEAGYSRDLLLALREISLQAEQNANPVNRKTALVSKANLAYLYREIGRTADAIRLFRECRDESILLHGRESKVTLQCIVGLGSALRVHERGAEGAAETKKAYEEMLDIASSIFERGHPELLKCDIRVAGLEYDRGNYKLAIERYSRGIINAAFLYGEGSKEVSYIRNQLAASLWADDQAMEALNVINKNIETIGENKAWGHDYIQAVDLKGAICYSNGDHNAAERCWLQCLASYDKTQAEDSPDKIGVLNTLGTLYHETERFEEALDTRKRQLKMAQRLLGAADYDSLNAAINYAHVLHNDGEITRSLSMLISIGKLFKTSQKRDRCLYIRYLRLLGVCSRNAADYKLSEDSLRAALLASEESGESSHVEIGQLMAGIANTLEAAEKYPECIDWRKKCLEHREGCLGARNASTSRARIELAKSYRINRQTSEALDELNKLESSIIGLTETTPAEENLLEECRALIDQIKRGGD